MKVILQPREKIIAGIQAQHERILGAVLKAAEVAADEEKCANAKIGDVMEDGAIYAGISPTTGERMYAAPADTLSKTFNEAVEGAETFAVGGRRGFRVPDNAELQVLYENRHEGALKGTFEETHSSSSLLTGWYWSSKVLGKKTAYGIWFSRGTQQNFNKDLRTFVRYIR